MGLSDEEYRKVVNPNGVTHAAVAAAVRAKLEERRSPNQVVLNHESAFSNFLRMNELNLARPFGKELTVAFDDALDKYYVHQRSLNRAESTIRTQLTYLRKYRDAAEGLMLSASTKDFHTTLREAMQAKGWQIHHLSRESGVRDYLIKGWLQLGQFPRSVSYGKVQALEAALGLPEGVLIGCCPWATKEARNRIKVPRPEIAFRAQRKKQNSMRYRLHVYNQRLREEWLQVLDFKSTFNGAADFNPNQTWTFRDPVDEAATRPWFACIGDTTSATAEHVFVLFTRYWGFLCLPKDQGGFGMEPEEMSLAHLLHKDGIAKFIDFMKRRAGGKFNKSTAIALGNVTSFLRKETGFVWIHTELLERAPEVVRDAVASAPGETDAERWRSHCEAEYVRWTTHLARLTRQRQIELSRDPSEPIREVLAAPRPLSILFRALRDFDKACPPKARPMEWATHKRDALVFALLVNTGLRSKHISLLTYREDNTGQLYQTDDGRFGIRIERKLFKNHRGSATERDYDIVLGESMSKRISEYLEEVRPKFPAVTDYLVTRYKGARTDPKPFLSQEGVYEIVRRISELFIPEAHGFGPHAIRHIIATDWLKTHPRDYYTAALILHDNLDTVLLHYSHLSANDAAREYIKYVDELEMAA
jgi:integrase